MKRFLRWLSNGYDGRWIGKYYFRCVDVCANCFDLFSVYGAEFGKYLLISKQGITKRSRIVTGRECVHTELIPIRMIKI